MYCDWASLPVYWHMQCKWKRRRSKAENPLQPVEEAVIERVLSCNPWEDHAEEDIHCAQRSLQWSSGYFLNNLWSMESPCWSRFSHAVHGDAHTGKEKQDEASERSWYRLTVTPSFLIPLHCLEWGESREVGNEGVKLSLGRRRGRRKVLLKPASSFNLLPLRFVRGVKRRGWVEICHLAKFKPP